MSEEHKHVWASNGCWCGAKQRCEYLRFITTPQIVDHSQRFSNGGMQLEELEDCDDAAVDGSKYCVNHGG